MKLNVEISKDHIPGMIDFYLDRQRALKLEIAAKEKESKDISAIIIQLKTLLKSDGSPAMVGEDDVYSEKWPWIKKIEFAIRQSGKALTTREIVDFLNDYDSGVMLEKRKAMSSVSGTLSVKGDQFVKNVNGLGENTYGLNQDEKAKTEFGTDIEILDDLPF